MVPVQRRVFSALALCLGLVAVVGCAASIGTSASTGTSPTARPSASASAGLNTPAFDALARQEAAAWARSPLGRQWRTGLVLMSADELSSGPSGGFPVGQDKLDFIDGDLVFTGPPPTGAPTGVVTWPDGGAMKVPVLSEAQTFSELTSSRQCPACATSPLDVTKATPTTLAVATSRGTANVPAWAFTLKGVSRPVIQAALPKGSYTTPGSTGNPSKAALAAVGSGLTGVVQVTESADGRTLSLRLFGGACESKWGALEADADGAVVLGGWQFDAQQNSPCPAMALLLPTTVRLKAPLGDRVIIDASTGQAITPSASLNPVPPS